MLQRWPDEQWGKVQVVAAARVAALRRAPQRYTCTCPPKYPGSLGPVIIHRH